MSVRFAALAVAGLLGAALPMTASAMTVAPPAAPAMQAQPVQYYYATPVRRTCWIETHRVWGRDYWGRPVPRLVTRQVCAYRRW